MKVNDKLRILTDETCALCKDSRDLTKSHIISALLLRNKPFFITPPESRKIHLRGEDPKDTQQDGEKYRLLCGKCEERLSVSERYFEINLFSRWPRVFPLRYESLMHDFVLSQTYRTLLARWHKAYQLPDVHGKPRSRPFVTFKPVSDSEMADASIWRELEEAENIWRECLLGNLKHPGKYRQYMIPLATGSHGPWALHSVIADLNITADRKNIAVYVLAGSFCFVGVIRDRNSKLAKMLAPFRIEAPGGTIRRGQPYDRFRLKPPLSDWMEGVARAYARGMAARAEP